jgi:hypothetical protein
VALAGGCLSALVALGRVAYSFATIGLSGQLNDFYAYWAAGVLLNRGQNPYDVAALAAVQQAAGVHVETGSGFSYPLLLALAYRAVLPGAMLGIASAIKLYPVGGFLAALTARPPRWRVIAIGIGVLGTLLLLQLGTGGGSFSGRTGYFLGPDTYWSNESINGWLSRLAIDSTWTHAPIPGFPVEAAMLIIVLLLAAATVAALRQAPGHPWGGALALSLWLGVVSAPKNSLWNYTPLLLAITFAYTRLAGRWWLAAVGVVGWLLIELQAQLDGARETVYQASPALAWLSSVGLYGALILGGLTAYVLLRPAPDRP